MKETGKKQISRLTVQDEDFILTMGWMRKLGLNKPQRELYALIWGYSRGGNGRFIGTAKYIAEWLDCKERQAQNLISQLEKKGLIGHEVVRSMKNTHTEFWAITPNNAQPIEGELAAENLGHAMECATGHAMECATGHAMECVTDIVSIYTRDSNYKDGGGKDNARRAKTTTTTTSFSDLKNGSGLTPGDNMPALPFSEPYFLDAWTKLLKQPAWQGKSPEALAIVLDRFAETGDPVLSAFCCIKAIENGWSKIVNPSKIGLDDQDQLSEFADKCYHLEGVSK